MFQPLPDDGASLAAVLETLGPAVASVAGEPAAGDVRVRESVLWDPMDPLPPVPGGIVLLVGWSATNPALGETFAELGRVGYTGAMIKRRGVDLSAAVAMARRAGVVLMVAPDDMTWSTLDSLLSGAITSHGGAGATALEGTASGDLFALANAIAATTDAAITIEDVGWHVLAYSNIDGQPIDEVRREGILGRRVPRRPEYQPEYRMVAWSKEAVQLTTDDGSLPRVAMPVRAGGRLLGSIWAIDGVGTRGDRIAEILQEIAPMVALHLLSAARHGDVERHRRAELLAAQLGVEGPHGGDAGVGLRDRLPVTLLAFGPLTEAGATLDEHRLTTIVALNAETLCPDASCAKVDDAIFVLLPTADRYPAARLESLARSTVRAIATAGPPGTVLGCAYEERIDTAAAVPAARRDIGTALRGMKRRARYDVVSIVRDRHRVVMQELIESGIAGTTRLIYPVRRILEHDQVHGGVYAATLLAHLDCFGDVRKAAERLSVHENSQRYRMRKIIEQFGLDLDDPELRLVLWLQLRIVLGHATPPAPS